MCKILHVLHSAGNQKSWDAQEDSNWNEENGSNQKETWEIKLMELKDTDFKIIVINMFKEIKQNVRSKMRNIKIN